MQQQAIIYIYLALVDSTFHGHKLRIECQL